jgi:hypothetical protein
MKKNTPWIHLGILITLALVSGAASSMNVSQAAEGFNPSARTFSANADYSSEIEKQILSGRVSTAQLIVDHHPRLWMRGNWDWDAHDEEGSFTWRFVHGEDLGNSGPANDQEKYEFAYTARYGDTYYYDDIGCTTFGRRFLSVLITAESVARDSAWNFPPDLRGTSLNPDYDPQHTEDELLARAREKLLACPNESKTNYSYVGPIGILEASVAYDWLVSRKYSDGITPVLSEADRTSLQNALIETAESMREHALGNGVFFNGLDISRYTYFVAGLALYEPSGHGISPENNAKAKQYLDEFDEYWVGKILPVLNAQGGTGGWHAGLASSTGQFFTSGSINSFNYRIAPFLFAHYTATGGAIEDSIFSTGVMRYAIEFQNHMIYPDGNIAIGSDSGNRYQWIAPLFPNARRRFSSDPEQQWLGELAGWFRNEIAPDAYVDAGSYCLFDQLMWEQKWPNPRSPEELGAGTRNFAKLGWVAMRSGFTSPDDLAALFISQRYHWGEADLFAQNSFHLMRKGWLIEGNQNTLIIDGQYQRSISTFPTIADGPEAYAPGSIYDVGPGILDFESNDVYDYMLGDATNAYNTSKLSKFTRQVVYLKPDIFVIFDRVVTTSSNMEKKWVADPAVTPQDQGNGLITVDNGIGALWIKRLLPTSASVSLSNEEIAVVPSQSSTETFFLHVMQAVDSGAGSGQVAADDATVTQEGDWFHVQVAGRKISFSKSGEFEFDGQPTTLRGDVNLDGIVDTQDIQLSINVFLAFERDPAVMQRADLNNDGVVNSLDIQEIVLEANK